ncbi:hypothetical protein SCALM49S_04653 [Streptomyces californicus]
MGFLPTYTDVLDNAAKKEPFVAPFVRTLRRRQVRPRLPGLGADRRLTGPANDVPGDRLRP